MNKENLFYLFLALIAIVVIVFLNAEKIWNSVDDHVMPLVNTGADAAMTPGSGSADAAWINKLNIHWDKGNVVIRYAQQDRFTWKETYVKGNPSRTNTMYYWMNTQTLFIHYRSQEYYDMNQKADREISKDLYVFVPQGKILEEIVIHAMEGKVSCEVEAHLKDLGTAQ